MEQLDEEFERIHPGIRVEWVILPENELRTRITADIATGAGSFDVVTVGNYEVPIWAENGWIASIDSLMEAHPQSVQADYDREDLLTPVRTALTADGELRALPFYAESSMLYYNRDLLKDAGLSLSAQPTWSEVREIACRLHSPEEGRYGIVLRGLPGWGEVMAPLTTVVNTFGGRWFDLQWQPQLTSEEWREAVGFYVGLLRECGPPGATGIGFTEALTLMAQGRAAMWVDATVAAGFLSDPAESRVAGSIGFAPAPVGPVPKGNHWLWVWSLAIPVTSERQSEALAFITWATSRDYITLVGEREGWDRVPPGTRTSTYERPEYVSAAPFAPLVFEAIRTADPTDPTRDPVPYQGIQFVGIPEFQGLGTDVSQHIADALAGNISVDEALVRGQRAVRETLTRAGYYEPRVR
ncbi:MAG TPA: sugar ABC transporter substrate-binding protein [Gemmatimonadota bacterium]|nr:sugar ABC transporter substrate-binding protein [Gemmatimonadota bacterium]